ncbi:MAG: ATP-binding cassette domain-containing protein, partial [Clostridia bacterium]|nr:ATP-binding cassette domain-containing protein [Clostridia bacterium]MBQ3898030.1 ATP-binding cassette domain-containing protein [Clostridia bacterium]
MLEIKNVTKTFNTLKAVDDLSFRVEDGEIVGFVGPNGAGKTTTMKILTGILKPDSGEVNINGFDMQKTPIEAKEIIGYIADSPD